MGYSRKILFWTPRLLCMLTILFVSLFALDSFTPGLTLWQQLSDFIIHLIPAFALTGLLVFAWKNELLGGIILIVVSIGLSIFIFRHNYQMNHSTIISLGPVIFLSMPFSFAGVLFIINHYAHK